MSSSRFGSGPGADVLRTNAPRAGPADRPGSTGFHCEAGASDGSRETFFGPVRLSIVPAIASRQLDAAWARSRGESVTRMSFSASAIVVGVISGPTGGAVPNAGGVPAAVVEEGGGVCASPCAPTARPATPVAAAARKSRRDFDMFVLYAGLGRHRPGR